MEHYLYTTTKGINEGNCDIDVHYTVRDDGEGDVVVYIESLHTKTPVLSSELLKLKNDIVKELYHYHVITGD